ncbi:MAG: hypothetical protein ACYTEL_16490 [Planctomycetota bacterium]|jgi:hypothetical protein
MRIALVPNDDGFGPSALAFYVAKALLKRRVSLVVRNQSAMSLNASFYRNEIAKGVVSLQPTFGGIRLRKTAEGVDTMRSLHDIQEYPRHSDQYVLPDDVDAVVDIGTPAAARAAHAARKPIFTVFDHAWGKTYEMTLDNLIDLLGSTLGLSRKAEVARMRTNVLRSASIKASPVVKAIERIKQDERKSSAVFLFESYITPKPFHEHWKSISVPIVPINGVFGGGARAPSKAREKARKRMGIPKNAPEETVYILGGGTSVWDARLPVLISQLKEKVLKYNVVIFDRKAKPNNYVRVGHNVYTGGAVDGQTVQGLLPGVNLVITRAGGGIVNDAIACRVPFVCVEEPKHRQVEMIRKKCMRENLTRTIKIKEFRTGNIATIVERELRSEMGNGKSPGNRDIRNRMELIKNGREHFVAEQIIKRCASARHPRGRATPSSGRRGRRG